MKEEKEEEIALDMAGFKPTTFQFSDGPLTATANEQVQKVLVVKMTNI